MPRNIWSGAISFGLVTSLNLGALDGGFARPGAQAVGQAMPTACLHCWAGVGLSWRAVAFRELFGWLWSANRRRLRG
jgi:hypothetical protein